MLYSYVIVWINQSIITYFFVISPVGGNEISVDGPNHPVSVLCRLRLEVAIYSTPINMRHDVLVSNFFVVETINPN